MEVLIFLNVFPTRPKAERVSLSKGEFKLVLKDTTDPGTKLKSVLI